MYTHPYRLCRSLKLLTSCLFACSATYAQAREITCYSAIFPPYVISQGTSISGIDVDTVAEAGRRAGVTVKFKLLPWVRLENEIKRGKASEVECAFAYSINETRKEYMDFTSVPIKVTSYMLFAKEGTFTGRTGVAELKGKTIGLRHGFVVPGAFETMRRKNELTIQETDSDLSNFKKLSLGRIDGIMTNADVGRAIIKQLQLEAIVAVEPAITETPTFLVFNKSKNMTTLVAPFDQAITEMRADGSYDVIRSKYIK